MSERFFIKTDAERYRDCGLRVDTKSLEPLPEGPHPEHCICKGAGRVLIDPDAKPEIEVGEFKSLSSCLMEHFYAWRPSGQSNPRVGWGMLYRSRAEALAAAHKELA